MAAPHVHHHHHHPHPGSGKLQFAFWLNLLFCLIELAGGFYTNSVAILSDALHDFGDSLSLGLAWYFERLSKRKPDPQFHYGYRRFSVLGALINSFILIIGSIFIIKEAVVRIAQPVSPDANGMLWLAIAGILINGTAAWRLSGGKSLNERVVSLHLIEDVLGWVAILIGALIMRYYDVPLLDPILSIAISVYILSNVYRNNKEVFRVILQGKPHSLDEQAIKTWLLKENHLLEIHDLRVWTLDNEQHVLSAHLVLHQSLDEKGISLLKQKIRDGLLHEFHIVHATLETEPASYPCQNCD